MLSGMEIWKIWCDDQIGLKTNWQYLILLGFPHLCTGKADGLYANHLDPSTYYDCLNGEGCIQKCPENLVFRQYSQSCDHHTTIPTETSCFGLLYGLFPDPYDQHCYYNCGHDKAHHQCCPNSLVFRSSCQCCDYDTTTHNENPCHGKPDGIIANQHNSHSYYKCVSGYSYVLLCPGYSIFLQTSCVFPTSIPKPCVGRPNGLYANHFVAHSYYICLNGEANHINCPGNLVYKQSSRCCVHPTPPPSENPCTGGSSGFFPDPTDNNCFYHCGNGIAYKKRCAER